MCTCLIACVWIESQYFNFIFLTYKKDNRIRFHLIFTKIELQFLRQTCIESVIEWNLITSWYDHIANKLKIITVVHILHNMCVYTLSCSQFHLIKRISKMYTSNGLFLWLLKFWTQCNCMQIALTLKSLKNTKCIHYGYIFSWYIDPSTLQRQNKVGMDLQNYFSKFKNWICSQLFSNNWYT